MTVTPLSRLLADGRAGETPLADCDGAILSLSRFRRDVAANAQHIRRRGCRRGLLLTKDAYWGAVGLFALMSADADVVMAPNTRPGIAALLAGLFDLVVTDTPSDDGSLMLAASDEGEDETQAALDPGARLTFLTSGSTGVPKHVPKTLAHLECEAETIEALLGSVVPREAKILATVPHQHAYGLAFRLLWPLATGRVFAAAAHELWETTLPALGPGDALITSPAHLSRMDGLPSIAPERRPSLVLSAGAPLAETDAETARTVFGLSVTEIFGSTETGAIASRTRNRRDPAWRPLPGVAIDATAEGLARVRAAQVPDGQHIGSDRVSTEVDGVRFTGRADSIVKIEGVRVNPTEVAKDLRSVAWIADAAVVAIGDPPLELAAAVALTPEGKSLLAEIGPFRLGRALRHALAPSREPTSLPRRWRFVDRVPTHALGKTDCAAIAALFDEKIANRELVPEPVHSPVREPETHAVRQVENGADIDLFISPAIVYFDGHFPGFPIVPAVAQIDWAVRMAARHLGLAIASAQDFRVKFRKVTVPGASVTLCLRHAGPGNRFTFEYRGGGEVLSSGTIASGAP